MSSSRSALAALASFATVVTGGAMLAPANANPSGTGLVISEVYGAGGNGGAVLRRRLRRALQPDRLGGQPHRRLHPLPLGERHERRYAVRPDGLGAGRWSLPDPDGCRRRQRCRAADARRRRDAGVQPGGGRRPGLPAVERQPDHHHRRPGRCGRCGRHGRRHRLHVVRDRGHLGRAPPRRAR